MQIEHKTEKGTILFVLPPKDAFNVRIRFKRFITWRTNVSSHIEMFNEGINAIGLTSEVTDQQAKMMLMPFDTFFGKAYKCRSEYGKLYTKALYSFKSLMQHLQITDEKWIVLFNNLK